MANQNNLTESIDSLLPKEFSSDEWRKVLGVDLINKFNKWVDTMKTYDEFKCAYYYAVEMNKESVANPHIDADISKTLVTIVKHLEQKLNELSSDISFKLVERYTDQDISGIYIPIKDTAGIEIALINNNIKLLKTRLYKHHYGKDKLKTVIDNLNMADEALDEIKDDKHRKMIEHIKADIKRISSYIYMISESPELVEIYTNASKSLDLSDSSDGSFNTSDDELPDLEELPDLVRTKSESPNFISFSKFCPINVPVHNYGPEPSNELLASLGKDLADIKYKIKCCREDCAFYNIDYNDKLNTLKRQLSRVVNLYKEVKFMNRKLTKPSYNNTSSGNIINTYKTQIDEVTLDKRGLDKLAKTNIKLQKTIIDAKNDESELIEDLTDINTIIHDKKMKIIESESAREHVRITDEDLNELRDNLKTIRHDLDTEKTYTINMLKKPFGTPHIVTYTYLSDGECSIPTDFDLSTDSDSDIDIEKESGLIDTLTHELGLKIYNTNYINRETINDLSADLAALKHRATRLANLETKSDTISNILKSLDLLSVRVKGFVLKLEDNKLSELEEQAKRILENIDVCTDCLMDEIPLLEMNLVDVIKTSPDDDKRIDAIKDVIAQLRKEFKETNLEKLEKRVDYLSEKIKTSPTLNFMDKILFIESQALEFNASDDDKIAIKQKIKTFKEDFMVHQCYMDFELDYIKQLIHEAKYDLNKALKDITEMINANPLDEYLEYKHMLCELKKTLKQHGTECKRIVRWFNIVNYTSDDHDEITIFDIKRGLKTIRLNRYNVDIIDDWMRKISELKLEILTNQHDTVDDKLQLVFAVEAQLVEKRQKILSAEENKSKIVTIDDINKLKRTIVYIGSIIKVQTRSEQIKDETEVSDVESDFNMEFPVDIYEYISNDINYYNSILDNLEFTICTIDIDDYIDTKKRDIIRSLVEINCTIRSFNTKFDKLTQIQLENIKRLKRTLRYRTLDLIDKVLLYPGSNSEFDTVLKTVTHLEYEIEDLIVKKAICLISAPLCERSVEIINQLRAIKARIPSNLQYKLCIDDIIKKARSIELPHKSLCITDVIKKLEKTKEKMQNIGNITIEEPLYVDSINEIDIKLDDINAKLDKAKLDYTNGVGGLYVNESISISQSLTRISTELGFGTKGRSDTKSDVYIFNEIASIINAKITQYEELKTGVQPSELTLFLSTPLIDSFRNSYKVLIPRLQELAKKVLDKRVIMESIRNLMLLTMKSIDELIELFPDMFDIHTKDIFDVFNLTMQYRCKLYEVGDIVTGRAATIFKSISDALNVELMQSDAIDVHLDSIREIISRPAVIEAVELKNKLSDKIDECIKNNGIHI